jgi:hypothetical protein
MRIEQFDVDDDELVRLWHCEQPMNCIAERLGINEQLLGNAWRHLKRKGMIPRGDRPRRGRDAVDASHDGRPRIAGRDPLLASLMREHGQK